MSARRFLGSRLPAALTIWILGITLLTLSPAFAADRYVRATVDASGQLQILTADGKTVVPPKDHEQVAFKDPQISADGSAVGWLAEYSYGTDPIPLRLVVDSGAGALTFTGNDLPIWRWGFQAGGRQVAIHQETLHHGLGIHYELRDVVTGRLVAEYQPELDRDTQQPLPKQNPPEWVLELDARRLEPVP